MTVAELAAFAAVLKGAAEDFRENKPLPPSPPMTEADAIAALKSAEPLVDRLDAWVKAHPGAVRALLRLLAYASAQKQGWASEVAGIVQAIPGGLDAGERWIPTLVTALTIFQPSADGVGGVSGDPIWRHHP